MLYRWRPCAAVVLALVLACGSESPTGSDTVGGRSLAGTLTADLTGATAVPGPGDPDGTGSARITLDAAEGEVCYDLFVLDIEPAFAAHIHEGAAGEEGAIVVGLAPPSDGSASGCATGVDSALVVAILTTPPAYYVNVHNQAYAAGAIRGQLKR